MADISKPATTTPAVPPESPQAAPPSSPSRCEMCGAEYEDTVETCSVCGSAEHIVSK